ncbi:MULTISPECIES: RHS repeat domain-containing protein [unclassified Brevundimonas]|uniref:RHS repeat domain-containing protein n=1 Tax=unclassified Brevundimonas TaxID=2622653 RepID=UPI001430A113|nr:MULTISPECIES: RHS repeat domain-containing protein [unclassified Brevundimonas]
MRAWLSVLSLAVWLLATWVVPVPAAAQTYTPPTGTRGWCTPVGPGQTECFPSPAAACFRQWQVYGQPYMPPAGSYRGVKDRSSWNAKECDWHYFGTPAPTIVQFQCSGGYTAVAPGRCVQGWNNFPQCLPSDGAPNFGARAAACTPRPISILSGTKTFDTVDFETETGSLLVERHYSSLAFGGAAGTLRNPPVSAGNWRFGFSMELQLTSNLSSGVITVLTPQGLLLQFQRQPDGSLAPYTTSSYPVPRTDYSLELVGPWPSALADLRTTPSTWRLRSQQAEWIFVTRADPVSGQYNVGRPSTMTEREGPTWTFAYGSAGELTTLSDQFGNSLGFTWIMSSAGAQHPLAVSEIALPGGRSLRYFYEDAMGGSSGPDRLMRVDWLDASNVVQDSQSYVYGDARYPTFVTEIRDRDGVGRQFVQYQMDGKASSSGKALGAETYAVSYASATGSHTRVVTTPLGRSVTYRYSAGGYPFNTNLIAIDEAASPNAPAASQAFSSTAFRLTSQTDQEGRVTTFSRDAVGRPTTLVEASGTPSSRTTQVAWNAAFNVPDSIAQPGLTTTFTYDAAGRILTRTQTDTTTHATPYATNGRSRMWTYAWTAGGQLASVDGPLPGAADTVSYGYTPEGWLSSVTDEVGLVTTITTHDWRGAPLAMVDPNGVETQITYDIRGRPTSILIDPGPSQSLYQAAYDAAGNLRRLTLPEGGWLEYVHDAADRLVEVRNDRGEKQTFDVNALGEATAQEVRTAAGSLTSSGEQAFDELGRLIRQIGAASQTAILAYDKVGNLTQVTDPRGKVWGNQWDALNRLVLQRDPENHDNAYAYAPNDALSALEDGRGLETQRVIDGFGLTIFESSPDRGERTYWYDAADRLVRLIDADEDETLYAYDAASRQISETFVDAAWENISFSYDSVAEGNNGQGRLTGVTDQSGTSSLTYDRQGRLTQSLKTIQGHTYTLAYAYDTDGEVTRVTLPSGRWVDYTRDPEGRVSTINTRSTALGAPTSILGAIEYAPFGPMISAVFGNGLAWEQAYDGNYWQTGLRVGSSAGDLLSLTFARNETGALTGVGDAVTGDRGASFGYTDDGRLQYAVGAWGDESYGYDASGNRTEVRRDDGSTVSYEFALTSPTRNRINEVRDTGWSLLRDLSYRDGGDLYAQDYTGGSDLEYHYGARKRLLGVSENSAVTASYSYDYLGRRVARTLAASGQTIHYVFDDQGRLHGEYDGATGQFLKEYVWLDDRLTAVVTPGGTSGLIWFVHTGQIAEPLLVTNASGAVAWSAVTDPWGQAAVSGTPLVELDLRLPGQWAHAETGLHQNWMRDYDPTLGRYVQTDPAGQQFDLNLYAYAISDPLSVTDPYGLFPMIPHNPVQTAWRVGRGYYGFFRRWRQWGHEQFPGEVNSRSRHCSVSCITGSQTSIPIARTAGVVNEVQGFVIHDIRRLPSRLRRDTPWAFQWSDLSDNERGFAAARCLPINSEPEIVRNCILQCTR